MEINVTIFLQAMQFVCVYYFLYKFLFVPASKILDEQEQFKHNLYKNLETQQQVKDVLLRDYHIKNDACKTSLLQTLPEQATESVHQPSMFNSVLDMHEKNQLSPQDRQNIQLFLVDSLSRIIKK
jgi:hypothetical protein